MIVFAMACRPIHFALPFLKENYTPRIFKHQGGAMLVNFKEKVKIALIICSCIFLADCKKDDDDDEDSATSSSATASQNLGSASENLVPGSLAVSTAELNLLNPCAGTDGFLDCQPVLLKFYLDIAKQLMQGGSEILANVKDHLGSLPVGTPGEVDPNSAELSKIAYNVTSAQQFKLLFYNADEKPFMYLNVDESKEAKSYIMQMKPGLAPDGEEGSTEVIESIVTFTSDESFIVDVKVTKMGCSNDDVRSPDAFALHIERNGSVWAGKAMAYQPLFHVSNSATCETESSSTTKNFMYTDFVGNDENSTASVYMLGSSVDSADTFGDWDLSDLCTNFASSCNGGKAFGDPNPVSDYKNPLCAKEDTATWDGACADFGADDYSAESNWIVPTDMQSLSVDFVDTVE
jgi:hypothetical protein